MHREVEFRQRSIQKKQINKEEDCCQEKRVGGMCANVANLTALVYNMGPKLVDIRSQRLLRILP